MKVGTFAFNAGKYYCKPHFKQLFAVKGNYTGGFGEKDAKSPSSFNSSGYGTSEGTSPLGRKPSVTVSSKDRISAYEAKKQDTSPSVNGSSQHLSHSENSAIKDRMARFGSNDEFAAKDKVVETLRQQLEERDAQITLLHQENESLRAKLQSLMKLIDPSAQVHTVNAHNVAEEPELPVSTVGEPQSAPTEEEQERSEEPEE
ncbi:hypothetical protein HDU93_003186 [Gonapodya sp. JEL0774]|nr:hypothetical protein HDU93_003186 [Gonapodya sp. JEL0774]